MLQKVFRSFLLTGIGIMVNMSCASSDIRMIDGGFAIEEDSLTIRVVCLDDKMIHVQAYPTKNAIPKESMVVDDKQFRFSDYDVVQEKKNTVLQTKILHVAYDPVLKNITFTDRQSGKTLLSEKLRKFVPAEVPGEKGYSITQSFTLSPQEAIYGLGQYQDGVFNYRRQTVDLVHANREIANPILLSTRGYLIYWDNYSKTTFTDNDDGAQFWSEFGEALHYYFVYGSDMNNAIAGLRNLTGQAPMFPKSAFGFWMSKERYSSFDELTGVVAEYRRRKIPLDNIVQDWQYWGQDMELWNSMEFNPEKFDHPKETIDKLHNEYHVKLTLSVWPSVGKKTKIYQDMEAAGVLFDVPTWAGYKVIDIYSPKAREIYWDYLYKGLYSKGVDSWWLDATEPSFKDGLYQDKQEKWTKKAGMTHIGSFHRYLNTYSLVLTKMMYENLRKQSNNRVSILTRSAFAGQQKYATSTWSGDIYASWDVFRKQIPAGLNLCMTGIPYWTTDIGGFRVVSRENSGHKGEGEIGTYRDEAITTNDGGYTKGLEDPAYLELYTRWFQYGVFNPLFRAHGTEVPREIWHFGKPGTPFYDVQLKMIHLRYSLLSYIYSNAWKVTSQGGTMMRALAMDFTDDTEVYDKADGFMFGDALLVHPVTHPMYYDRDGKIAKLHTEVSIYLPKHKGVYWFDLHSDKCYTGGKNITYDAPLEVIPVFAKAGSIVVRNQPVEYANADNNKEMDIIVYAGQNAAFTLYEDDNETYNYESGEYLSIDIVWNENDNQIVFSGAKGKMTPPLKERTFNVQVIRRHTDGSVSRSAKKIIYKNTPLTLNGSE